MSQSIGPPIQPAKQIAERAKLIVARAERETRDEAVQNSDKREGRIKDTPRIFQTRAERLPDKLEQQPLPARIDGQVIAIDGNRATVATDSGRVEIDVPPRVRISRGDRVAIDIPAHAQTQDTVQVEVLPPARPSPPPEVDIPVTKAPTNTSYPPATQGQRIVVTDQPRENYKVTPESFKVPVQPKTPTQIYTDVMTASANLTAAAQRPLYDLATTNAGNFTEQVQNTLYREVSAVVDALSTQSKAVPGSYILDDNLLTQGKLRPVESSLSQPTTHSARLDPSSAFQIPDLDGSLRQSITSPAGAFINAEQVTLLSVQTLDILSVIPAATAKGDMEGIVAQALSTLAATEESRSDSQPNGNRKEISLARVMGTTANGETVLIVPAKTPQNSNQTTVNQSGNPAPPLQNTGSSPAQLLYVQSQVFLPVGAQVLVQARETPVGLLQTMPDILSQLPQEMRQALKPGSATTSFSQMPGAAVPPGAALPPPLLQPAFAPVWPALTDTISLAALNSPSVSHSLQQTLPSASPRMVSSALFFVAALKLGNIENWLGDKNLDAIKQMGKKGLVERLAGDFSRISQQFSETNTQNWKSLMLPMLNDGDISNVHLHVRQDDHTPDGDGTGDENQSDGPTPTRFILDLTLSRMGPVQLDGYLTAKTLDMILRNRQHLQETDRQALMQTFANTLELTGLKGSLRFQAAHENWVRVHEAQKRY